MKKVSIFSVMSELGAGTRGASLGFDALLTASHNVESSIFNDYEVTQVETSNHLLFEEINTPFAKHLKGIKLVHDNMADQLVPSFQNNEFPVLLSGAHSVAAGTIKAIKKAYPNKKLGVVWIDAHADLHSPYTTPSGNVHGMPLGMALKEDNKDHSINHLDENTIELWEQICGDSAAVTPENLVFFGVRDTEIPEDELIERKGIKNYTVEEVRRRGVKVCVEDSLSQLSECDLIYVSFDVDSMDSAIADGTGTPVINGFAEAEANKIIQYLLNDNRVCCFEMVEINPTLDTKGNAMAETAFRILNQTLSKLAK